MSFGMRVPSWQIRGDLSFARCEELTKGGEEEYNIADRPKKRSVYWIKKRGKEHPLTHEWEPSYVFQMYQTDILTWFKDGTIAYRNYNSAGTREVQSRWGPIKRLWNDSRIKFRQTSRFGEWRGNNYPFEDPVVHPDGMVHGLVDTYEVIDPAKRKERMAIAKQVREQAIPRIMLGEFGDTFHANGQYRGQRAFGRDRWDHSTGWHARIPYHAIDIANTFARKGDMDDLLDSNIRIPSRCIDATDEYDAVRKCVNTVIREALTDSRWYIKKTIEYPPVQVKE